MNWHFVHPLFSRYLWGFLAFSKSWVVAKQNSLIDLLIIRSLIDHLSGGFGSFCKTKCSSLPKAFDFAFLLSYHLIRLMWSSGRYKSGILVSCHVAKSKTEP
jgi:hypothetical protein